MALLEVAVQGLTVAPQGIVSGGVLSIVSVPSTKVKAEGKGVYKQNLQFTLSGANAVGYDPGTVMTVGTASISPTSTKNKAEGQFVMRKNDQNLAVNMTGTIGGTPTPFIEPWKITVPGQTKVIGE